MTSKLGAQCQMNTGALLEYCRIVKPKAAMGIMVQERGFYEQLSLLGVQSVYRHFPNYWWYDPERHAQEAVGSLVQETAGFRDLLTWVLGNNEWCHAHMKAEFDKADRFMCSFIEEVHEQMGLHAIVGNFATGNFRNDILSFPRTLAALDRCGRCRLGWHEYGWPSMYTQYCDGLVVPNDGMWHCLRWKVAMQAIKNEGYHNIKVAITECGIDGGVVPGQNNLGWRKVHPDFGVAMANYLRSLAWYVDAIERDPDVDFALLFGCGLNDDWKGKGFCIAQTGIAQRIANYKIYPEVRL